MYISPHRVKSSRGKTNRANLGCASQAAELVGESFKIPLQQCGSSTEDCSFKSYFKKENDSGGNTAYN